MSSCNDKKMNKYKMGVEGLLTLTKVELGTLSTSYK
jgi:hypothetical protein